MKELTFEQDCLIGAADLVERFFCSHSVPIITGLAYNSTLTESLIVIGSICAIALAGAILLKGGKCSFKK